MKAYLIINLRAVKVFLAIVLIVHIPVIYAEVKVKQFTPPSQCSKSGECDNLPAFFSSQTTGPSGNFKGAAFDDNCDNMQTIDSSSGQPRFDYENGELVSRFFAVSVCANSTDPACKILLHNKSPAWSNPDGSAGSCTCTDSENGCPIFNVPAPVKRISLYITNNSQNRYFLHSTGRNRIGSPDNVFPAGNPATPFFIDNNMLKAGQQHSIPVLVGSGVLYDGTTLYNANPFGKNYPETQDKTNVQDVAYKPDGYNIEFYISSAKQQMQNTNENQPIGLTANNITLLQITNNKTNCFPTESKLCQSLLAGGITYSSDGGNKQIKLIIPAG